MTPCKIISIYLELTHGGAQEILGKDKMKSAALDQQRQRHTIGPSYRLCTVSRHIQLAQPEILHPGAEVLPVFVR